MTERKRAFLFWLFKGASVLVACALPIWAILERFPLWVETNGAPKTAALTLIMIAIVLLIVFRRSVFEFLKARLKLKYAPPMTIWAVFLIISYVMMYVAEFLSDLNTVFWMGLIGAAIGAVLTYVSNKFKPPEAEESEEDGED